MRQIEPQPGDPIGPPATLRKIIPFEADAASDQLGWVGLEAARYRAAPASELNPPAITHPRLVLFSRPPDELDLRYEGVKRHVPPPAGSISVVPAGSPAQWRWSGSFDWLHIFLEPGLVARVAAEAFGLDPARLTIPPLDNFLLIEALREYHNYYGDTFHIECPSGSGRVTDLDGVAHELAERVGSLFVPQEGRPRPCHGSFARYAHDPHWRDYILFYEYFDGDTGRGLGASHQTGWTALVACLLEDCAARRAIPPKPPET